MFDEKSCSRVASLKIGKFQRVDVTVFCLSSIVSIFYPTSPLRPVIDVSLSSMSEFDPLLAFRGDSNSGRDEEDHLHTTSNGTMEAQGFLDTSCSVPLPDAYGVMISMDLLKGIVVPLVSLGKSYSFECR